MSRSPLEPKARVFTDGSPCRCVPQCSHGAAKGEPCNTTRTRISPGLAAQRPRQPGHAKPSLARTHRVLAADSTLLLLNGQRATRSVDLYVKVGGPRDAPGRTDEMIWRVTGRVVAKEAATVNEIVPEWNPM